MEHQSSTRGRVVHRVVLLVVAVVSWALALYFRVAPVGAPLVRAGQSSSAGTAPSGAPTQSAAPSEPALSGSAAGVGSAASASASSSAAVVASAAPATTASGTAGPAVGTPDVTACVVALFPEETFDEGKADFSFICQATDPLNAVIDVQSQIVSGRRVRSGVTPGMREWSHLGWYQVAAYAVMRGHCCASAAAHKWTLELPCPFDEAVAKLEAAARAHDEQVLEGALGYYTTTARCLARAGLARAFQLRGVPGPGMAAFRHLLQRMREADRR